MKDGFRIEFELLPLDEIHPWGDPETGFVLHWFGLTDGWYDLCVGRHRLYASLGGDRRGIDYQVVRLWEDLLRVAPFALEPLPDCLAAWVARDGDSATWIDRVWREAPVIAVEWLQRRWLDSGHLQGAPSLFLWRHGKDLHLRWRSPPRRPDWPAWTSPSGDAIASGCQFREELIRFDRELISAMKTRVDEVTSGWNRPEVEIDLAHLRREQAGRAAWLERALHPRQTAWDEVVAAMAKLGQRF